MHTLNPDSLCFRESFTVLGTRFREITRIFALTFRVFFTGSVIPADTEAEEAFDNIVKNNNMSETAVKTKHKARVMSCYPLVSFLYSAFLCYINHIHGHMHSCIRHSLAFSYSPVEKIALKSVKHFPSSQYLVQSCISAILQNLVLIRTLVIWYTHTSHTIN